MELKYPADLAAWLRWQQRAQGVVAVARKLKTAPPPPTYLVGRNRPEPPRVVVGLESAAVSSLLALAAPLLELRSESLAVVVPAGFEVAKLPLELSWEPAEPNLGELLTVGRVVLAAGHYLPLGRLLYDAARARGAQFVTVQHGLLTPWTPPLAEGTTLLAFSDSDAAFWRGGRQDVQTVTVGSELLWRAAAEPAAHVSRFTTPTFLGQLHGAELPRLGMIQAASSFCLNYQAAYRPHPSERDRLSRAVHATWRKLGVEFASGNLPVAKSRTPVVAAFSTGLLEAAAAGVPAWAYYPSPPRWLAEFWDRYQLHRWGQDPTPAPRVPATAPAKRIADWTRTYLRS